MPQLSDIELNSLAGGVYRPNNSIIRIDPLMSIWSDPDKNNIPKIGIFVHEYIHYLHNYSTYSGLFDFVSHVRLARLFTQTVNSNGRSEGGQALKADEQSEYASLLSAIGHVRGRVKIPSLAVPESRLNSAQVVTVEKKRKALELKNSDPIAATSTFISVQVLDKSGNRLTENIEVGSIALLESAAWEIERIIYSGDSLLLSQMEETINVYPYKFARLIFKQIGHIDPKPETVAKACILALQSSDPGDTFVELVIAVSERINKFQQSEETAIEECSEVTKSTFKSVRDKLIQKMVEPELSSINGRTGLSLSLSFHRDLCIKYLDLRIEDAFFEVNSISPSLNFHQLNNMMAKHPPCPIIEASDPPKGESSIFFISADPPSEQHMQSLGLFQSFMHFMQQHIHPSGFLSTDSVTCRPCTFYGACINPKTITQSETCTTRPWQSFDGSGAHCWYAGGVASSIRISGKNSSN